MIENSKTRIILDGKILGNVAKICVKHDYKEVLPTASIALTDESIIETRLVGIDQVKENHLNNNNESINWLQYICNTI